MEFTAQTVTETALLDSLYNGKYGRRPAILCSFIITSTVAVVMGSKNRKEKRGGGNVQSYLEGNWSAVNS